MPQVPAPSLPGLALLTSPWTAPWLWKRLLSDIAGSGSDAGNVNWLLRTFDGTVCTLALLFLSVLVATTVARLIRCPERFAAQHRAVLEPMLQQQRGQERPPPPPNGNMMSGPPERKGGSKKKHRKAI